MRILRGLSSRRLACGCIVGLYETYDGRVTEIVDHRDPACPHPRHRPGAVVSVRDSDREFTDPADVPLTPR